jgi:hypothetical protein
MALSPFLTGSEAAETSTILDPSAPNSSKSPADAGEAQVPNQRDPTRRVEATALPAFFRRNMLLIRLGVRSTFLLSCSAQR